MTNTEFKTELDRLLNPQGFKKNGNKWTLETDELEKIIELQKSNFSNSYYLNYGFNLKDLDYKEVPMHIWNRLGSLKRKDNKLIFDTLDLTNAMDETTRIQNTRYFVNELLLPELNATNTKSDLIEELKCRKHLNDIFVPIREHLNLKNTAYNNGYNSLWQRVKSKFNL